MTDKLQAERGAALLAVGRLDGGLAAAPPLRLFAHRVVRRTLVASLAGAGFAGRDGWFDDWLARRAGPPEDAGAAEHSPEAVAGAVLAELRRAPWAPLADAAAQATRAAAHLARQPVSSAASQPPGAAPLAGDLVDAARGIVGSVALTDDPSAWLEAFLAAAMAAPWFAPPERAVLAVETWERTVVVEAAAPRGAAWALGLALGGGLRAAGLLRVAVPLAAAVPGEALRGDLEPAERAAALFRGLGAAAAALFSDLQAALDLERRAAEALAGRRSTSRAPEAFDAIAGLGPLRRSQVAALLGVTPLGADAVVDALVGAGLVERSGGHGAVYRLAEPRREAPAADPPGPAAEAGDGPPTTLAAFDVALAAVDALLARSAAAGEAGAAAGTPPSGRRER